MGKASRNKRETARDKIAAQRAAAHRATVRRRAFVTGGSVAVVIVIVVAFIVAKSLSPSGAKAAVSGGQGAALPASVMKDVATVPAATLDSVGPGAVPSFDKTPMKTVSGSPLAKGGKPEVLFVGAEWCPFCAAERWSIAVALSRFGTFSSVRGIHSSATDKDPNTPTLTFYKSSYHSKYVAFSPVEIENRAKAPLQHLTKAQQAVYSKYLPGGGFPFLDVGNRYVSTSAAYDPAVLAGKSWTQVSQSLAKPSSPIAQGADGGANYITAAICKVTHNQPSAVCSASAIQRLQGAI